jgi:hypothetical protein
MDARILRLGLESFNSMSLAAAERCTRVIPILLVLLIVPTPAIAQEADGQSSFPDFKAETAVGSFSFSGVRLLREGSRTKLQGTITNQTGHDWPIAWFDLKANDGAGGVAKLPGVRLSNFANATDQKFSQPLSVSSSFQLASITAALTFGRYRLAYVISLTKPIASETMRYEDPRVSISFLVSSAGIGIDLKNRAGSSLRIKWDEAAYVNSEGETQKVMHNGVRFIERNSAQLPTIVPPLASYSDVIVPTNLVEYSSPGEGIGGGWSTSEFLPSGYANGLTAQSPGTQWKGRTLGVYLPMEIAGKTTEYMFRFLIKDVR